MKKVIFYLFEQDSSPVAELSAPELRACEEAYQAWQQKKRVLIACQDQQQAERLDEYLWQLEPDHFVPHNLAGEGPRGGAPIEISWPEKRSSGARQLLINLQQHFADFMPIYQDIIDFVPADETLKTLARERYHQYKNVGFNLKTIPVSRENSAT